MSDIRPFRALRYDPARVDLGQVLVPPYDVISAADRARLYDRCEHSAIRLELTREVSDEAGTDYGWVRETLDSWRETKVLIHDERPAFYGLRTRFVTPDGDEACREGFFGALHLEDYERRIVRPHERTLAGPKADRLKILRASEANLSSVFLLYEDRDDAMPALLARGFENGVVAEVTDEAGATHTLMRFDEPEAVASVQRFMAERPLVIADGHHRYETGLAYRDERRKQPAGAGDDAPHEFLLAYFANVWAPGSLLLPIHRLIKKGSAPTAAAWSERMPGWEQKQVAIPDEAAIPGLLASHLAPLGDRFAFAADDASGTLRIFSRARGASDELSVRIVHREIIEGVFGLDEEAVRGGAISYPKSAAQTARDVRSGEGSVALYLNPLSPDDVFRVTAAGEVMPQKSTFFAPKLPTGLVFRLLEGRG
jgi:uncharacterized protein (DUF1015 family)